MQTDSSTCTKSIAICRADTATERGYPAGEEAGSPRKTCRNSEQKSQYTRFRNCA